VVPVTGVWGLLADGRLRGVTVVGIGNASVEFPGWGTTWLRGRSRGMTEVTGSTAAFGVCRLKTMKTQILTAARMTKQINKKNQSNTLAP